MKKHIKKIVSKFGYDIVKKNAKLNYPRLSRDDLFAVYFSLVDKNSFYFIQIGANDGVYGDPVHKYINKYKLKGTVVEPLSDVFIDLKNSYSENKNIVFENVAVSETRANFYKLKEDVLALVPLIDRPRVTAVASFDRKLFIKRINQILPKIIPEYNIESRQAEEYTEVLDIPTCTINDLCSRAASPEIDMLFMDCQGKDYEILKKFNFDRYKPSLINFEYIHLTENDRIDAERILEANEYRFFYYGNDICAYRN